MTTPLEFAVHVSPSVRENGTEPVPRGHVAVSSPLASTLIYGRDEAILVDPPWHVEAVSSTVEWVTSFGRELRGIYITHGHGDHWLGAGAVAERFPGARVWMTKGTVGFIRRYARYRQQLWDERFPGQVATSPLVLHSMSARSLSLEDHEVSVLELGHTDTDDTTAVWVPSLGLLVGGDSVYNRCHLALNEIHDGGAECWLAALGQRAALGPATVVAGHKDPGAPDGPECIAETRSYIMAFQALVEDGREPLAIFDGMMQRFPSHVNPKALWRSVTALRR